MAAKTKARVEHHDGCSSDRVEVFAATKPLRTPEGRVETRVGVARCIDCGAEKVTDQEESDHG